MHILPGGHNNLHKIQINMHIQIHNPISVIIPKTRQQQKN